MERCEGNVAQCVAELRTRCKNSLTATNRSHPCTRKIGVGPLIYPGRPANGIWAPNLHSAPELHEDEAIRAERLTVRTWLGTECSHRLSIRATFLPSRTYGFTSCYTISAGASTQRGNSMAAHKCSGVGQHLTLR